MEKKDLILLNKYRHYKKIELIKKLECAKSGLKELSLLPAGCTPYAIAEKCLSRVCKE